MRNYFFVLIMAASALFVSCDYGIHEFLGREYPVTERAVKINDIKLTDSFNSPLEFLSKEKFSFLVISDVHIGSGKEKKDSTFIEAIKTLNEKPAFCICLGDVAHHGFEEEYKNYNTFIVESLAQEGIQTYTIAGNHDLFNNGWEKYTKYIYPYTSFYRFQFNDFSFYFLDSASGSLGFQQTEALKKSFAEDKNIKYVFSHYAIYSEDEFYWVYQKVEERNNLISLFAKNNVKAYFGGHIHAVLHTDFGKFQEVNVQAFYAPCSWVLVTVDMKTGEFTYRMLNE